MWGDQMRVRLRGAAGGGEGLEMSVAMAIQFLCLDSRLTDGHSVQLGRGEQEESCGIEQNLAGVAAALRPGAGRFGRPGLDLRSIMQMTSHLPVTNPCQRWL